MTQRLSRPLWLLLWDGEEKEEIFFSFREGEPVWRRRERLARERQLAEPKGQDGSKDRTDSFLSCVPGPPPVSFLQIGFIECNILIKNTHTFPFGCIKRFLTKHCNVAINPLPPEPSQVITQLWHFAFNVYFDGYVPARVGAQGEEELGGERGPKCFASFASHSLCVFNKGPANWGANTWEGRRTGDTLSEPLCLSSRSGCSEVLARPANMGPPEGSWNVPFAYVMCSV